jgi:hypothetical protein
MALDMPPSTGSYLVPPKSWRSAANAPDEYQNAIRIVGAFASCNGVLGGTTSDDKFPNPSSEITIYPIRLSITD